MVSGIYNIQPPTTKRGNLSRGMTGSVARVRRTGNRYRKKTVWASGRGLLGKGYIVFWVFHVWN